MTASLSLKALGVNCFDPIPVMAAAAAADYDAVHVHLDLADLSRLEAAAVMFGIKSATLLLPPARWASTEAEKRLLAELVSEARAALNLVAVSSWIETPGSPAALAEQLALSSIAVAEAGLPFGIEPQLHSFRGPSEYLDWFAALGDTMDRSSGTRAGLVLDIFHALSLAIAPADLLALGDIVDLHLAGRVGRAEGGVLNRGGLAADPEASSFSRLLLSELCARPAEINAMIETGRRGEDRLAAHLFNARQSLKEVGL